MAIAPDPFLSRYSIINLPKLSPVGSILRLFASARTPSPKFKASRPLAFNADTMVDLPEPGMPVRQTISFAKMKLFTNSSL